MALCLINNLWKKSGMISVIKKPDVEERLSILSQDSQYDLACACNSKDQSEHRRRSQDDRWIYPVILPGNRKMFLLRTLISNICSNDCKYCPLRSGQDITRCGLSPEETARVFFDYNGRRRVSGLFLTSGVIGTPDRTMDRLIATAAILRRQNFKGYIHLKIIPGASDSAIEKAVSLSSAVSLNIETPGENHFKRLSSNKDYINDIIRPIKLISALTAKGERFSRVKQTTQFVVGASDETDREIVKYTWGLYRRLKFHRVYFSAYQRGLGDKELPGERSSLSNNELLTREHRLYQTDFLMRKYGFSDDEIPFSSEGNLSLETDPKEAWARANPQFFPVNINRADRYELLRVPGLGHVTVDQILELRKNGSRIRSMDSLGKLNKRLVKASGYVRF